MILLRKKYKVTATAATDRKILSINYKANTLAGS
jgi:hypothetical protein